MRNIVAHRSYQALKETYWDLLCALTYVRAPSPTLSAPESEYSSFLRHGTVALVGPAPTMHGTGRGDEIESFDRVVRLNHALPIPPELINDIGERTDIIYHNLWQGNKRALPMAQLVPLLVSSVKWICSAYPYSNIDHPHAKDIDAFLTAFKKTTLPFRTVSPRPYLRLKWSLGMRPNAGISALHDLLRFDIKKLYLTGFTFYQKERDYYDGYRGYGCTGHHDQNVQIAQVRKWVQSDTRIRYDETIKRILFP